MTTPPPRIIIQNIHSYALVIPVTQRQIRAYVRERKFPEPILQASPSFPKEFQPAYFPIREVNHLYYNMIEFPFIPFTRNEDYREITPAMLKEREMLLHEFLPELGLTTREERVKRIKGFLKEEKMADEEVRHFTGSLDDKSGLLHGVWEGYRLKQRVIERIEEIVYAREFLDWPKSS